MKRVDFKDGFLSPLWLDQYRVCILSSLGNSLSPTAAAAPLRGGDPGC